MIKVNRLNCPKVLKGGGKPISDGEFETLDAILFYSDPNNQQETYRRIGKRPPYRTKASYITYKDDEVRVQLAKMFHEKCAYCESYIKIYSGDIEHFRPKGGYGDSEPITKPGYYWLASDWDNLLFACPFCNQTNTLEINEGGIISEKTIGKKNQFPLETETNRLTTEHGQTFYANKATYTKHHNLEESDRLLLKPCTDEIEKHFKYLDEGVMLSNDGLSYIENKRANTSLNVYALKRTILINTRKEKVIEIKAQIRRLQEAIINLNRHINDTDEVKAWYQEIFDRELTVLNRFKDDDQEFAGLARYIIQKYLPPPPAII